MNIESKSFLKNFGVGGLELTRLMDRRTGLSGAFSGLKSKGTSLDSIAKAIVSEWIVNPGSIRATHEIIFNNDVMLKHCRLGGVNLRTYYRALEIIGKHAGEIYAEIIDNIATEINLDHIHMDWTSSFFYGEKCKIAKKGYSRDHRSDKKQVKIGLAISGSQAIPLYYSVMQGNIHDAPQFRHDFTRLKRALPKDALIILDKGADSKENRKEILDSGFHFLTAAKMHEPMKKRIRNVNKSEMQEIGKHKDGKKVYVYEWSAEGLHYTLYLDERRFESDQDKRKSGIAKAKKEYEELEQLLAKGGARAVQKRLSKKTKRITNAGSYVIEHNVTVQKRLAPKKNLLASLKKDSDLDGMFVLVSSKKINPKKKLRLYRRKSIIEKMISDIKSVMKLRPFRVWNENEILGCVLLKIISILMIGLLQMDHEELRYVSKSTIINMLKNLTVVIKINSHGAKTMLGYANTTETLVKIFKLGT